MEHDTISNLLRVSPLVIFAVFTFVLMARSKERLFSRDCLNGRSGLAVIVVATLFVAQIVDGVFRYGLGRTLSNVLPVLGWLVVLWLLERRRKGHESVD